jgi:hypothetical protein
VFLSHNTGLVFLAGAVVFLEANRRLFRRARDLLPLAAGLVPLAAVAYLPLCEGYQGFPNLLADHHATVVGDKPSTAPPPALALQQIGLPTRVNFKGLTGLAIGPLRVGVPDENAYLFKVV